MNKKKLDLKFGFSNEIKILPIIENYFKLNLKKPLSHCCRYDFYDNNNNNYFELKSRNNNKDKYNTTIISKSKIDYYIKHIINNNKNMYCLFYFLDGLYYIKVDENFKKYNICKGGRCDRGKFEYNDYYYIPVRDLIKIPTK